MPDQDLTIEIKIDGATAISGDKDSLDLKNGNYVHRFQVDTKIGMPAYFEVQLQMKEFKDIILLDKLKPGAEIEMKVGYETEATIFKGEVSHIAPHFAAGEDFVVLSGYDGSHRLMRGTSSRTFGNGHDVDQNFGDILGTIIGDSKGGKGGGSDGLAAQSKSTDAKAPYIAQYNASAAHFIQNLGAAFGLDWNSKANEGSKSLDLKPLEKGSKALTICRDKYNPDSEVQAITADFRVSTVKQVSKVIVRGWDIGAKKSIVGKAESVDLVIGGTPGYEQAGKAHFGSSSTGRTIEVTDIPVHDVAEANEVAASIMAKHSMDWMTGTVRIHGRPDLVAGKIVELKDFGTRYSGEYLVEGCNHVYLAGSATPYSTYLYLARNGSPEP